MNKREKGKEQEEQAARYLAEHGFVLLEKNFRSRQGEVDLVGLHENCLVFVEVKYRKNASSGLPEEAVGSLKQSRICLASDYYRLTHPEEGSRQIRYDVVAICGEELSASPESIHWYQNAFPYTRRGRAYSW